MLWPGFHLQVSINVSILDLGDEHFVVRLAVLLYRHAIRPDSIDIEVTESAVMKDLVQAGRQLDAVRRLGVAIEIDAFGTPHRSFASACVFSQASARKETRHPVNARFLVSPHATFAGLSDRQKE